MRYNSRRRRCGNAMLFSGKDRYCSILLVLFFLFICPNSSILSLFPYILGVAENGMAGWCPLFDHVFPWLNIITDNVMDIIWRKMGILS